MVNNTDDSVPLVLGEFYVEEARDLDESVQQWFRAWPNDHGCPPGVPDELWSELSKPMQELVTIKKVLRGFRKVLF